MEYTYAEKIKLVSHTLTQLIKACDMIIVWNKSVSQVDDYLTSPEGVQKMAASCMLIESIGEGLKKIDRTLPDFLQNSAPDVPWHEIIGLRNHIAHGYFNLDADIIFDVSLNEIPSLKERLTNIRDSLTTD
jgi:uncharacterized protein with HEPN domain